MHASNLNDPACHFQTNAEGRVTATCPIRTNIYLALPVLAENVTILSFVGITTTINQNATIPVFFAKTPLKYNNVTELRMNNMYLDVPRDFFSFLHSLKKLSMEYILFGDDRFIPDFPLSITMLKVIRVISLHSDKPIDLSKLDNLEDLTYSLSKLQQFPSVSQTAPLKQLNLSRNYPINISLLDIAPYCLLKNINLTGTRLQFTSFRVYCELKDWFEYFNMTYEFDPDEPPDNCPFIETSQEAIKKYDQCIERTTLYGLVITPTTIFFTVLVFGLVVLAVIFRLRKRFKSGLGNVNDETEDEATNEET